jgi:hypothetical protein
MEVVEVPNVNGEALRRTKESRLGTDTVLHPYQARTRSLTLRFDQPLKLTYELFMTSTLPVEEPNGVFLSFLPCLISPDLDLIDLNLIFLIHLITCASHHV